jgi:LacI family transcriptional regulator
VVTSIDVARLAGVSQATVSRVLSGSERVSPQTRQRVLEVLEETGYTRNAAATTMRTKRSGTIGLVVERVTNPFYPEIMEALGLELERRDLRLSLWNVSVGAGERAAIEAIKAHQVDGLVFTTATVRSPALLAAVASGAALVLVNRVVDGVRCDQVESDNRSASGEIARYFAAHGHQRVGLIGGPTNASTTRERVKGFKTAAKSLGLEVITVGGKTAQFSHEWGYDSFVSLAADHDRMPTALFCANDLSAFGVLGAAKDLGIRVPDDIWVVGFDDISMASWPLFDLTTARQDIDAMTTTALDLLVERIADPERAPTAVRLPTEIVVRGSTGNQPLPHAGPS